jgi:hypothetical protein
LGVRADQFGKRKGVEARVYRLLSLNGGSPRASMRSLKPRILSLHLAVRPSLKIGDGEMF